MEERVKFLFKEIIDIQLGDPRETTVHQLRKAQDYENTVQRIALFLGNFENLNISKDGKITPTSGQDLEPLMLTDIYKLFGIEGVK